MEKTETFGDAFERLNNQLDSLSVPAAGGSPTATTAPVSATPAVAATVNAPEGGSKFVFTFNPLYIYGAIPILILVVLMVAQPDFIKEEVEENGEKKKKMNFKKVLLWTTGFSIVIMIAVFAYFYQQNKLKAKTA